MDKQYYRIVTYGCQMNTHESEKIAGILEGLGYFRAEGGCEADVVVFNTCCIRENAERRAYGNIGALKGFKQKRPDAVVCVVGCMTQQEGAEEKLRRQYPFVDIVMGTHHLCELADLIRQRVSKSAGQRSIAEPVSEDELPVVREGRVKAWVNIMYGCDNFCTYCIVPYVRGRERSRPSDSVVREVSGLLTEGFAEITLLGQNVNSYNGGEGKDFAALLRQLAELPYCYRLRFMTSHPKDLTEEAIAAIADYPNLCKCVHLPVQSGSDRILRRMNRKYNSAHYLRLVERIYARVPGVRLTSDVMVGFPGETEEDFADTLNLVRCCRFSNAFTFVYSPRKGTAAERMGDQVPEEVKKRRIAELIGVQNEISRQIGEEYVGRTYPVLIEEAATVPGRVAGRTDCGRMVSLEGDASMIGSFRQVEITRGGLMSLTGRLVD